MMKLPKQWKHWCKKAGLKPSWKIRLSRLKRKDYCWAALQSETRYWRIDMNGLLCVSCHKDDFDRWANSEQEKFQMPTTERELVSLIDEVESLGSSFENWHADKCVNWLVENWRNSGYNTTNALVGNK